MDLFQDLILFGIFVGALLIVLALHTLMKRLDRISHYLMGTIHHKHQHGDPTIGDKLDEIETLLKEIRDNFKK